MRKKPGNRISLRSFGEGHPIGSECELARSIYGVKPERRGINSIQLFRNEHGHWQITSMIWDNERTGLTVA